MPSCCGARCSRVGRSATCFTDHRCRSWTTQGVRPLWRCLFSRAWFSLGLHRRTSLRFWLATSSSRVTTKLHASRSPFGLTLPSIGRPPAGCACFRRRSCRTSGGTNQRAHHGRRTASTRFMSLRRSSTHPALSAGEGDQVQLLALPAHWRTLGVLRVRNGSDRGPSEKHHRIRLGGQDAAHSALQDLRVRYALGATRSGTGWKARCQHQQL